MWPSRQHNSAMDSPLGIARPWTPPETDTDPSPRSDYFSSSITKPFQCASDGEHAWSDNLRVPQAGGARCDTPVEDIQSRPKPVSVVTAPMPYTPTKKSNVNHAHMNGALQYPYTPDSSRILSRSITELPSSPIPWNVFSKDSPEQSPSPVQDALSSCITHFEDLLKSHAPDEEQMEYIIAQFEAMANHLETPQAQTKPTGEHLFANPESDTGSSRTESPLIIAHKTATVSVEYVAEVDKYIESVSSYIGELKMRLDEVRALNSIQCDVIQDLRRQMKAVRQGMRTSLSLRDDDKQDEESSDGSENQDESEDPDAQSEDGQQEFGVESWETLVNHEDDDGGERPSTSSRNIDEAYSKELQRIVESQLLDRPAPKPRTKIITIIRKPERRSFWRSFGEALDAFGTMLNEE